MGEPVSILRHTMVFFLHAPPPPAARPRGACRFFTTEFSREFSHFFSQKICEKKVTKHNSEFFFVCDKKVTKLSKIICMPPPPTGAMHGSHVKKTPCVIRERQWGVKFF
jgi:hypothetical protein